ncbi:MAG: hypothetical protein A2Y40_00200 [Candidatus Margulisbacteria bacterium GWF2_35_9]|nr:MAG: hypothetical protein A2Y40_00200 [Candidatus Margulisbacteria bacterium GWF2_35_9]
MAQEKTLIMVVEDEVIQAQYIAETIVATNSYTPVIANNGLQAFELIKNNKTFFGFGENKIKAILLDINMPEMNGIEFLEKLRAMEKKNTFSRFTPVIVITAHEEPEYIEDATHPVKGMVAAYLKKPFNETELKDLLDKILQNMDAENLIEETRKESYKRVEQLKSKK